MVGLLASITHWVRLGVVSRHNFNLDSDKTVVLHLSFVVFGCHGDPEAVSIFFPLVASFTILCHVAIVVIFVQTKRSLCDRNVIKNLLQVDSGASNDVVALEEVTIVGLQIKPVALARESLLELETVVETGLAVLATVVTVSLLSVL